MKTPKEQLSELTEEIFKSYKDPGLHVCDLATGGGKSYTIAKLVCGYYPEYFKRIVILCCQNKLVDGMDREIERFIGGEGSLLKPEDKLVVRNNIEVAREAVGAGKNHHDYLSDLADEISDVVGQIRTPKSELLESANRISDYVKTMSAMFCVFQSGRDEKDIEAALQFDSDINSRVRDQIVDTDKALRRELKSFFLQYKKHLEISSQKKNMLVAEILKLFPSLEKAYPHVRYKEKKVLLMTGHKACWGIDPILSDVVTLTDLADDDRNSNGRHRTLFFFDESDQLAVGFRQTVIDNEVNGNFRYRSNNIYMNCLTYMDLTEDIDRFSSRYHKELITKGFQRCREDFVRRWQYCGFDDVTPFKNILPADADEFAGCRNSVFFCGPFFKMDFGSGEAMKSFICANLDNGENHFELVHSADGTGLKKKYRVVMSLDDFVHLVSGCNGSALTQLARITRKSLEHAREAFRRESGSQDGDRYFGFPSREREIHTLFSRFGITGQRMYENQLSEYMQTRKNQVLSLQGESLKVPDYSIYFQGIRLYREDFDDMDNLHNVSISSWEINTTPEKMLYELLNNPGTSVVLCSATASGRSVVNNFDMEELRSLFRDRMKFLPTEKRDRFDILVRQTYPEKHKIEVHGVDYIGHPKNANENQIKLPSSHRHFFCSSATESGLVDAWFALAMEAIRKESGAEDLKTYHLSRLYQFIETYHWFYSHGDIHSMLYFQNSNPKPEHKKHFIVLACLIDGSYLEQLGKYKDNPVLAFDSGLPEWKNDHLTFSNKFEDVEENLLSRLGKERDAKLMLMTAYNSFKAGANLQYSIPDGLEYMHGDDWTPDGERPKKDWDAIYLQLPSNYMSMPMEDTKMHRTKGILDVMLKLMMFWERGWLDRNRVKKWLNQAAVNKLWFSEPCVAEDKAAWVQSYIEQAIGRICRTRNKPSVTYILYDRLIEPFILERNLQKSLTAEFRSFADSVLSQQDDHRRKGIVDTAQVKRVNDANNVEQILDRKVRSVALHYISHLMDDAQENSGDLDDEEETLNNVVSKQTLLQNFKRTIIRKPVIDSLEDLEEEDRICTFIDKCYGDWEREDDGSYKCYYSLDKDTKKRQYLLSQGDKVSLNMKAIISSSKTRLDVFMKNDAIRRYFEANGFATHWKPGSLILHPDILMYDYTGEIGEEAFKALVLEHTSCTEESLTHLEGKDYELADFVVLKPDGTRKAAFDVKNFDPKKDHYDRPGDISTADKREKKLQRLGCPLYTVNMVDLGAQSSDRYEITGMLDLNGRVIDSAMQRIKDIIGR